MLSRLTSVKGGAMGLVNPENNLPDGAPAWVTPSLVADTIEFVRDSTGHELTPAEAIEFMVSFSQVTDLLQRQSSHKEASV
jgi:hypothetical protein